MGDLQKKSHVSLGGLSKFIAIQIKLDELIRAVEGAHNSLLDIEELTDEEICKIKAKYLQLAKQAIDDVRLGRKDTGQPDIT